MNLKKEINKIKNIPSGNYLEIAERSMNLVKATLEKNKNSQISLDLVKKLKNELLIELKRQPILKNSLDFLTFNLNKKSDYEMNEILKNRIEKAIRHIKNSPELVSEIAVNKIKKGMIVFAYDYSPFLLSVLLKTKENKINFIVNTIESKPTNDTKTIASILAKNKIPVKYYPAVSLRQALKEADIVFLGANLISKEGKIYSKIGSELISDLAQKYEIPTYVCTDSWMCSPSLTKQYDLLKLDSKQIWSNPRKGIKVINHNFEKIDSKLITGVITGLGIFKTNVLIHEIKNKYPWI